MKSSKVFISYSHDSPEHRRRALELAQQLRREGIDATIDQFEQSPPEGWARWMHRHIVKSDFVLAVCTATYRLRFEGLEEPTKGLGANWEGFITSQMLYDDASLNPRVIPVLFDGATGADVPTILKPATRYHLPQEYEALYRRLTDQPFVVPEEIGAVRKLPPVEDAPVRSMGAPSAPAPAVATQPLPTWHQISELLSQHRPHSRDQARTLWAQLRQTAVPSEEALAAATQAALRPGVADDEAYSLARLVTVEEPGSHLQRLLSALLAGNLDGSPRTALHVAYSALALGSDFERLLEALENGAPPARADVLLSAIWLALEQTNAEAERRLDRIEAVTKLHPTNSNARRIYLRLTGLELAVPVRPNEADRFEMLRRDARAALSRLDKVVREALYYEFRGEVFKPDQDQWRSAEQAVEEGALEFDEDEGGFRPDKRDRSVKSAVEALKRLDGFVSDDATPELIAEYETEHSIVVDMKLRPFWRKLGL